MPRSRRRGRAPPSLADFDPNIGIAERDPDNPSVFVYFVCVKSVHDPSFEVRTTPESYPPPPYPLHYPSSVAGEPYHSQI